MHRVFDALDHEWALWRSARISRAHLGKYIILLASIMHVGWAMLLFMSYDAAAATPIALLVQVFGGRYRTGIVLVIVAVLAVAFIRLKATNQERDNRLVFMLVPQEFILLLSAIAGVWAVCQGHYADGVIRAWPFILADQLPVILIALLYTAATVEASLDP